MILDTPGCVEGDARGEQRARAVFQERRKNQVMERGSFFSTGLNLAVMLSKLCRRRSSMILHVGWEICESLPSQQQESERAPKLLGSCIKSSWCRGCGLGVAP